MTGFLLGLGLAMFIWGVNADTRMAGAFLAGMPIGYYVIGIAKNILGDRPQRVLALSPEMLKQLREDTPEEKGPPPVGFTRGR